MKKIVRKALCATLAASVLMLNCQGITAADTSVSYSDVMADGEVHSGSDNNIDIEAEEIFGAEKATTKIDSNSKKTDDSASKKTSKSDSAAKKTVKAEIRLKRELRRRRYIYPYFWRLRLPWQW